MGKQVETLQYCVIKTIIRIMKSWLLLAEVRVHEPSWLHKSHQGGCWGFKRALR